ncbi:MAG: hypothetical protein PHN31_03065 [Candidatus Gracilibacteria bacterium]|nr:hypothetical protein [Candidatus Gracilibacteria bacterium]
MFVRIFKYSLKNILRNKFLSISSIIILSLLIFFINILLVLHNVSFKLIDSINSKLSISLYLQDSYDKNSLDVIDMINSLQGVSKSIEVNYKSKELLIDELREKDPKLVGILENENPLPNTIIVSNIGLNEYSFINSIVESKINILENSSKNDDNNQGFADYKAQYSRILKVIGLLNILRLALYVIIGIFLLSISVIVYSIIGNFIYYYKDEIYITKLVGGNNFFIHGPFIMQGVTYTLVSFIFASMLFVFLLNNLSYIFSTDHSFDFLLKNFNLILFFELILFILIGAISGYISSKKYIKN